MYYYYLLIDEILKIGQEYGIDNIFSKFNYDRTFDYEAIVKDQ